MSRKLLKCIKSMYVNNLACVRVKGGERECFRIDSGVPFGFQCTYGCSDERGENSDGDRGVRF